MSRLLLDAASQALADGVSELEVSAPRFAALVADLEARFPGLGKHLEGMALAVDGVIYQQPWRAPIAGAGELVPIARIGNG